MRPENDLSHEKKDQNSAEGSLSAYRSGDQQHASDEGAGGGMLDSLFPSDLMLEFVPPIEIPSLAERISGLEMFLTLMCQGNAVNTEAILSSLPNAMRHTLSPQQSFMMLRHFIYSPPPPEPFYLSQFVDKMKSMKSSWHILFFMLQQHVENPLLLWNGDTLRLLHASLTHQCENLDFLRRLRQVLVLLLFVSNLLFSSDMKHGMLAIWKWIMVHYIAETPSWCKGCLCIV